MVINAVFPVIGEVHIETCDKRFGEFIKRQFYVYVSNVNVVKKVRNQSFIIVKSTFIVQLFRDILMGNTVSYARQITIRNQKLYLHNIVFYINEANMLVIEIEKAKTWAIEKVLFHIKQYSETKKYAAYHLKFYNQVLFPIFLLYSFLGYYLVHGSLLRKIDKCVLVTGLDGVGKSSIGNELQRNGWHVCADNFVLFNGESAVALNLAMRLEAQQETVQRVLFQMKGMKEVVDTSVRKESALSPQAICILTIGKQFVVKKVACKEVYWSNYMNNAPEIAAANAFIAPVLLHNICADDTKRTIYLNIPTYVMEIPKGELGKAAKSIEKICGLCGNG